MTYYFVKFSADYSDEFDVKGCTVTNKTPDKYMEAEKALIYPTERWFGTNESIEFNSFEEHCDAYKFIECSKEFYDEFFKMAPHGIGYLL